jgi:hypothetical protein
MELDSNNIEPTTGSRPVLSSQTLLLISQLETKEKRLAQMLQGAWFAILDIQSPESVVQAAHSVRELMEKAPIWIKEVPVQQGSKKLKEEVKALHEAWKIIKSGNWSSTPPWNGDIDKPLGDWLIKAGDFFDYFSNNHQTRNEQMAEAIKALDQSGRPLPQNLIAEKVKDWSTLNEYFQAIAHHSTSADSGNFQTNLSELESFLLDLLHPEPIPLMDELDNLISEGESHDNT